MAVEALRERSQTILEMAEWAHCYYEEFEEFDDQAARAILRPAVRETLAVLREAFAVLPEWNETEAHAAVEAVADNLGMKLGKVAQPLRVALTGQAASPGIGVTLMLVGRDRTLGRIDRALAHIDASESTSNAVDRNN